MLQTVELYQPFKHRGISLHVRIADRNVGPRTFWLTISLPWKRECYDINIDEMVYKHPRIAIGFRFWRD
jgi:hypothetical protein